MTTTFNSNDVRFVTPTLKFRGRLNQRQRELSSLIGDAKRLAAWCDDGEAVHIVRFLEDNAVAGIPGPDRTFITPLSARNPKRVICVPVELEDATSITKDHPAFKFTGNHCQSGCYGEYYRSLQLILVPGGWGLSQFWQSLVLLHEAHHAWQHLGAAKPMHSRNWREWAAHALEHRLFQSATAKSASTKDPALLPETLTEADEQFKAGFLRKEHARANRPRGRAMTAAEERLLDWRH